ncbi:MAG: hypothetical protein NTY77_20050 [Elusimicrobia bacterium]|nr:hypothetical protein [Elusimicrobiota bacterium]
MPVKTMAWAAILWALLASPGAASECPSIVTQLDSLIEKTGVKPGDARHEQVILTFIKGVSKNENLTEEAKKAAVEHLWKQIPAKTQPTLPLKQAAPPLAKPAERTTSSSARPLETKSDRTDTSWRPAQEPPTKTSPSGGGFFGLGRKSRADEPARVIGQGPTSVEISQEAMRVSGVLRLKRPVEACGLKGAELQPGQQIASPQIVAEYAQRMKAGRWDWSRGEKIILGVDGRGGRVIIEGHHRYMAAKLAGVKIPDSAFSVTRRPWVPSSWEDVVWSASH